MGNLLKSKLINEIAEFLGKMLRIIIIKKIYSHAD